jgi:manganese transport protein
MTARKFRLGPGILITAAFIGPGTIATASIAGANYGFALCWALLFSIVATFVLQEMSARLGIVTGRGLAENLRSESGNSVYGRAAALLVVAAIGIGNAAYEAGNITGAALALNAVLGADITSWSFLVGLAAACLLFLGSYKMIERITLALVLTMSLVFFLTMIMVKPSLTAIFGGLINPTIPDGATLTVLALIGTTVVPYNLFLHSSTAARNWSNGNNLRNSISQSRWDSGLSIGLGGLITLAVLSTSAAAFFGQDDSFSAATMSQQLEPLLGPAARYFFAAGLFAAGLTSAITAPLAASYAVCGVLGWPIELKHHRFRAVWLAVLACGTLFSTLGIKPLSAILFAQAANGFLLPICAIFLIVVTNRKALLKDYSNTLLINLAAVLVVTVTVGLGLLKIVQVLGLLS